MGSDVEIYMDGGIRHGTDILKALALGARAVFVGRPVLWGLASGVNLICIVSLLCLFLYIRIHYLACMYV